MTWRICFYHSKGVELGVACIILHVASHTSPGVYPCAWVMFIFWMHTINIQNNTPYMIAAACIRKVKSKYNPGHSLNLTINHISKSHMHTSNSIKWLKLTCLFWYFNQNDKINFVSERSNYLKGILQGRIGQCWFT